jgi:hypothetical protein
MHCQELQKNERSPWLKTCFLVRQAVGMIFSCTSTHSCNLQYCVQGIFQLVMQHCIMAQLVLDIVLENELY